MATEEKMQATLDELRDGVQRHFRRLWGGEDVVGTTDLIGEYVGMAVVAALVEIHAARLASLMEQEDG